MFYTIYKTTNIINGKHYIGKHQTRDLSDGYMGSGKMLKRAIKKYGRDNFYTEILYICESEKQMNSLEKILVVPDPELNYNLCEGGKGGWSFINREIHSNESRKLAGRLGGLKNKNRKHSQETKAKRSIRMKKSNANSDGKLTFKGHTLTKEHKERLNGSRKGIAPWNKGIKRTDEEKEKISKAVKKAISNKRV